MTWSKIAEERNDNPKIRAAGLIGAEMHTAAITWSNRNGTDGFIPRNQVKYLWDANDVWDQVVGLWGDVVRTASGNAFRIESLIVPNLRLTWEPVTELLERVGLWDRDPSRDGWVIHGFLKYNPSRAVVLAQREAAAVRKARFNQRKNSKNAAVCETGEAGTTAESGTRSERRSERVPNGEGTLPPVPVPVPYPDPREEELRRSSPSAPTPELVRAERASETETQTQSETQSEPPPKVAAAAPPASIADPKRDSMAAQIREVFEFWKAERQRRLGDAAGRGAVLGDKRRRKIQARLADGFTVDQLKAAIVGVWFDEWCADKGYTGIETVLRDEGQVERFAALAPRVATPVRKRVLDPATAPETVSTDDAPARNGPALTFEEFAASLGVVLGPRPMAVDPPQMPAANRPPEEDCRTDAYHLKYYGLTRAEVQEQLLNDDEGGTNLNRLLASRRAS